MQQVIQIMITPEQLESMIDKAVEKGVKKAIENIVSPKYGKYVTREEAAEILKCSIQTIGNYDKQKLIIRANTPGGLVRYALEEIERFAVIKGVNEK